MSVIDNKETHRLESLAWEYYNQYISKDITYKNCEIIYTDNIENDYNILTGRRRKFLRNISGTTYYNNHSSKVFIQYQDDYYNENYYKMIILTTIHELIHINDYVNFTNHGLNSSIHSNIREQIVLWSEFHAYYLQFLHMPYISAFYNNIKPELFTPNYTDVYKFDDIISTLQTSPKNNIDIMIFMACISVYATNLNQQKAEYILKHTLNKLNVQDHTSSFCQLYNLLHKTLAEESPEIQTLLDVFSFVSDCRNILKEA